MRVFLFLTPFLLAFTGCATTPAPPAPPTAPKPEISTEEYRQYAFEYSRLNLCLQRGHMDGVDHAKGAALFNRMLANTGNRVDWNRMRRETTVLDNSTEELQQKMDRVMTAKDLEKDRQLVKVTCQRLSGENQLAYSQMLDSDRQQQRQNEINQQQQYQMNQQRQNQIYAPAYNKSTTTSCHQFGSQVICNSF